MRDLVPKFGVLLAIVFVGMLLAGLYGAFHNQLSYTVSREYFTEFKFLQFGLSDPAVPERVRASIVGFLASWWMGFPIGLLIGLVGLIQQGYKRMFTVSIKAMLVAIGFTLLFGLAGLILGSILTSEHGSSRRFIMAGLMHNSAYLGGIISIFVAWIYQVMSRARFQRQR